MPSLIDLTVGELALQSGLVDSPTLQDVLSEGSRTRLPVSQILVRRRLIKPEALLVLIRAAETARLSCPRCGCEYSYDSLDPNREPVCQVCGVSLTVVPQSQGLKLHDTLALTQPDTQTGSRSVGPPTHRSSSLLDKGAFGPYELLEEIGRGGMGVVYKASRAGESPVALKVLLGGKHARPSQVQRFRREAELASRLSHPNVVEIHDVGRIDDHHYLTMDLVVGRTLSRLRDQRRVSSGQAAAIVRDLARGLEHAHGEGVIHRDIKPANIIITDQGTPVITDFGLARDVELGGVTQLTRDGALVGTPFYMSPEQATGQRDRVTAKSDVYALGVVLYELLCQQLPFTAETQLELTTRILNDEPPHPRDLCPKLDRDLETVVLKALCKSPGVRYTAGELADDLDRYLAGEPIMARPLSVAHRLSRGLARNQRSLTLVLGALAVTTLSALSVVAFVTWLRGERADQQTKEDQEEEEDSAESGTVEQALREEAARVAAQEAQLALDRARRTPAGAEYRFALEEAARLLTEAIAHEANAKNARLRVQRARVHARLRRQDLAVQDLERAIALDPRGVAGCEGSYLLARLRGRAEDLALARQIVDAALKRKPERCAWLHLLRCLSALNREDLDQAQSEAERALGFDTDLADAHLQAAQVHLARRRYARAERALLEAVDADGKSAWAWAELARLHLAKDPEQGASDLKRALELDPLLAPALEIRAQRLQMENKLTEAAAELRKVLEQRPRDPDVLFQLYQLYKHDDQGAQATQMLERLRKVAPADHRPYRVQAWDHLYSGEYPEALQVLRAGMAAAARADPNGPSYRYLEEVFERLVVDTNQLAAGRKYAEDRLAKNPKDPDALTYLVKLDLAREAMDQAARRLAAIRSAHPRHLESWELEIQLGLLEQGWSAERLRSELERYARVNGQDPGALTRLAKYHLAFNKDTAQARRCAENALTLDPSQAEAHLVLGHIALERKRFREATRHFLDGSQADPEGSENLHALGLVLLVQKRLERARIYFALSAAIDPFREAPIHGLGVALYQTQSYSECEKISARFVDMHLKAKRPPSPAVVSNLVRARIKLGKEQEAFELIDLLRKTHPDPSYTIVLAEAHFRMDRPRRAKELLLGVLAKHPQNKEAKELLKEVERRL